MLSLQRGISVLEIFSYGRNCLKFCNKMYEKIAAETEIFQGMFDIIID